MIYTHTYLILTQMLFFSKLTGQKFTRQTELQYGYCKPIVKLLFINLRVSSKIV